MPDDATDATASEPTASRSLGPTSPPPGRLGGAWRVIVLVARRLIRRFRRAQVSTLAAALAYYAAFSLGPLLLLLGGWLGSALRARPELAARYRTAFAQMLEPLLPEGFDGAALVERSFDLVLTQLSEGTILRIGLSVIVLLWASSGFFASLQRALEKIFDVPEQRGFLRTRAVALVLVASVAVVIGLELIGGSLASWSWSALRNLTEPLDAFGLQLPGAPDWLRDPGPLRLVLAITAFTATFRLLPRRTSRWWGSLLGALVSVGGLQAMRVVLPLAFDEARFNLVYGVIASVVVLLLWLFLTLLLVLVGAVVAAEVSAEQRRRERKRQRGRSRPSNDVSA